MDTSEQLIIDKLLAAISEYKASDMHLVPGNYPIMRVNNQLVPLNNEKLINIDFVNKLSEAWLDEEQKKQLARDRALTFIYISSNKMRFRGNIYYQEGTQAISIKYISNQFPDVLSLGLPTVIENVIAFSKGLVIIAGSFGSGKTTTVASILNHYNQKFAKHIVTLEKPIEYIYPDNLSIIEQREIGKDTPSLLAGLRFVFDEDIDIVYFENLEGAAVIKEAFRLVDSGRLVIVTMNTDSVINSIENIINEFSSEEKNVVQKNLSNTLAAIIVQKILPGMQGSPVLACEYLLPNANAKTAISLGEMNKISNLMYSPSEKEMVIFERSLADLVNKGLLNISVALELAHDKELFHSLINQ